jgi:hypothetical protein
LIMVRLTTAVVKATLRCAGVAIAICSWIAISNHCTFAAVTTNGATTRNECPFHSKPAKQKQQSPQVQCCKILRAIVLAQAKGWARDDTKFFDAHLYIDERALVACSLRVLPVLLLDPGPPGTLSFAELILQRSLFAHAPPSLA